MKTKTPYTAVRLIQPRTYFGKGNKKGFSIAAMRQNKQQINSA
jgi:hypothetical protein